MNSYRKITNSRIKLQNVTLALQYYVDKLQYKNAAHDDLFTAWEEVGVHYQNLSPFPHDLVLICRLARLYIVSIATGQRSPPGPGGKCDGIYVHVDKTSWLSGNYGRETGTRSVYND